MLVIGVVAAIVLTTITLLMDWFPEPASTAADDIDFLYDLLLVASVPIFVLVMTIAIYSVITFRARPGDQADGEPIHGNTRLEIVWVTIPFLIVSVLAGYAWIVLDDIEAKQSNEVDIKVVGQQFTWYFGYPRPEAGEGYIWSRELVLPRGQPVKFEIEADDVIHSFWVPEFRLKQDAVPGIDTEIRLTPDRNGRYSVVCAELCGIGHATMRNNVQVLDRAAYDAWFAKLRREPAPPPPGRESEAQSRGGDAQGPPGGQGPGEATREQQEQQSE
jgi:cytochrome c oxidase subunit II